MTKNKFFSAAKSSKDSTAHDYQITVAVDNEVNDQTSIVVTSPTKVCRCSINNSYAVAALYVFTI